MNPLRNIRIKTLLASLRSKTNELWSRKNTFLLISASLEVGVPIVNSFESVPAFYEPLSSEIEAVCAALSKGLLFSEMTSQDFNGPIPSWIRLVSKYENGKITKGIKRLSRFGDKPLPLRIILNWIFWRSEPERFSSWLQVVLIGLLFVPVLPWQRTKDGIVVLGIFKGDVQNIYSMGLSGSENGAYLNNLNTYLDGADPVKNIVDRKQFTSIGRSYGYSDDDIQCAFTKEIYLRVIESDNKINQFLDRGSPSPVPIVWMYRVASNQILKALVSQPEYSNLIKRFEFHCAKSPLNRALNKSSKK